MPKRVEVWRLSPELAMAYRKILSRAADVVDTKGRGSAAARRRLAEAVAEGRAASSPPAPKTTAT